MLKLKQTAFALAAFTVSCAAFAGTECTPHPKSEQIPAAKFQQQLVKQGYQIKKFKETKGNCYEIYGKDKNGKKVEIYFDTKTGKAVKTNIE